MTDPKHLVAGHLDDTLGELERQQLAAWLKAHPDNLRQFVDASLFDESLRTAVRSRCQQEAVEAFDERVEEGRWARTFREVGTISRCLLEARVRVVLVAAGAAVLMGGIGWMLWLHTSIGTASGIEWARVVQTRSTQGAPVMPSLQVGRPVPVSRIILLTGAVELSLNNGVAIVFEGPGDLELVTPMRVVLRSGQAVVRVPSGAVGFQLETATAQVTDLGTEFGVKCGPGGVSEILVFDGKVLASAQGGSDAFPRQLTAGSAARFAPDQMRPNPMEYRPERFIRRLASDKPVELDEPGSPLFNPTRHEEVVVVRPDRPLTIDGDLSDWSGAHGFRAVRNESAGEFVEGRMRYDGRFLYVGAHVGDPAPLRNVVDPATDPELGWRGGGLQVRIATDPAMAWPVEGNSAAYYTMRRLATDEAQVARATDPHLVHLTLWHHAPSTRACLHLAFGMDLHGGQINPPGYLAAYRKDPDGRGYTLEYAIPWSLLNAPRVPEPGEAMAVTWTTHWSDASGRLWRGQWVELRNAAEPLRIHTWERAATWGKAVFQ